MLRTTAALLCAATLLTPSLADFGMFDIWESHPLRGYLTSTGQLPVVMAQYHFTEPKDSGDVRSLGWQTSFISQNATYRLAGEETPIFENVDALIVKGGNANKDIPNYLTLMLNQPTKVVVILNGFSTGDLSRDETVLHPAGFETVGEVFAANLQPAKAAFSDAKLMTSGFAVSKSAEPVGTDGRLWQLELPSPKFFDFTGLTHTPSSYSVLFVNETTNAALFYPDTPASVSATPILPHTACPPELHALWTVQSRDEDDLDNYVDGARKNHSTWHPLIDPVYYCSYGHDHGSYPGPVYKPVFTYTAWKTYDENNAAMDYRQDESDGGFKVFAFHEKNLHWVVTIHMHLSKPRRFHTRHHTMHVAVFDDAWAPLAELTMKADFGFAATKVGGSDRPLVAAEKEILTELLSRCPKTKSFRRFNVDARDDTCDFSGSPQTRARTSHGKRVGQQEHWVAGFKTCSDSRFRFDVASPETGLASCDNRPGSLGLDVLHGRSVDRKFKAFGNLTMALDLCSFAPAVPLGQPGELVKFYTDSYFRAVVPFDHEDRFQMAQWMVPGFHAVLPEGQYVSSHPWHGKYVKQGSGHATGKFTNIEGWAVFPLEN